MKSAAVVFWLILALVALASYFCWETYHRAQARERAEEMAAFKEAVATEGKSAEFARTNIPPDGPTIPGFTLIDQNGKRFDSKIMLGKVWVGSFFFTSCPGPCYRLNQALAGVQTEPDLNEVRFVSITCDPANDQPAALREYASRFSADFKRWTFLTGDEDQVLKTVPASFAVPMQAKTHSELAVVLDRQSRIRGYFNLVDAADVARMEIRLRQLLAEKDSPAKPSATPNGNASAKKAASTP